MPSSGNGGTTAVNEAQTKELTRRRGDAENDEAPVKSKRIGYKPKGTLPLLFCGVPYAMCQAVGTAWVATVGAEGCGCFSWQLPLAVVGAAPCGCPVVVSVGRLQSPHEKGRAAT